MSEPKKKKIINGKEYIEEETIVGDYAFVKAHKADTMGNLIFNLTSRNFNADIATAGKITIAEVDEIVETG